MAKIEDLVLTIDQMNYLKDLGVEVKDTALGWGWFHGLVNKQIEPVLLTEETKKTFESVGVVIYPTLTLQEILAMLPEKISVDGFENDFYFSHDHNAIDHFDKMRYWAYKHCTLEGSEIIKKTEFECAYSMLVWCAKQGYLNK